MHYSPTSWLSAQLGIQGTEKLMGRISFQGSIEALPLRKTKDHKFAPVYKKRSSHADVTAMQANAQQNGSDIHTLHITSPHKASALLDLNRLQSTPRQIGQSIAGMTNAAGPDIETFSLQPHFLNLRGPEIKILRKDVENALAHNQGSSAEIWTNAEINRAPISGKTSAPGALNSYQKFKTLHFILDTDASLSEEDSGLLYRTALLADIQGPSFMGLAHTGMRLRLNLHDNLEQLEDIRPASFLPVRSDIADFANRRFSIDTLYSSLAYSPNT